MIAFGDIGFMYFIFCSVIFIGLGHYWLGYGATQSFMVGWVFATVLYLANFYSFNGTNGDF
jgi:hypothetical protein